MSSITAPELPTTLQWINTKQPLHLSELRGKIVLLHFWTSGCIHCMHMMPDLKYLENKYRDNLVIIGIHSPRFPHDKLKSCVRKAINRFHIRHPVAHDPIMRVWTKYGIKAWPAIVFIDAEGFVVGKLSGEGRRRQLDQLILEHINKAELKGILNNQMISVLKQREPESVLSFPGKIFVTENHLYISDSGHNRVIEVNHFGRVMRSFGSGSQGLLDGDANEASFDNPQGLVKISNYLYVADTGNHAIRRIDLQTNEVLTIAGNGKTGENIDGEQSDPASVSLNSPWDICSHGSDLYIAMAGWHQIWKFDLMENTLALVSGNGISDLKDGSSKVGSMAQPSGLSVGDYALYVADAQSSSIRIVRLPGGQISTLVGKSVAVSGDKDGGWSQARLQHPQAVVSNIKHGRIYIADTYNNKIKLMDENSKGIKTIDSQDFLDEPSGLSLNGDTLWIANTNKHEILKMNVLSRKFEVMEINEPAIGF